MSNNEAHTVRLTVEVQDCGIAHLLDKAAGEYADTPARSIGSFIKVEQGCINLSITHQWGPANFTVTVAARDPEPDLVGYEDIVEISFVSMSGEVEMTGFTFDEASMSPLPPLPAGPGTYRVRYHIKGMDMEGTDDAVDDHFLQIWPAPVADPTVVKITSDGGQYCLDPEKFMRERGL